MLLTPLLDHGVHDLVRDELALLHVSAGEEAEGGAGFQILAEELAGDDVVDVEAGAEGGCVGAFADTRRTNEGDVHGMGEERGLLSGTTQELWQRRE
jgi:hypothetical protein